MATIRLHQVTKIFPKGTTLGKRSDVLTHDVAALDQVTLTVPNGQTMAIVGPSGSGKSTLLRVVAGLEGDYQGEVFYDGQEMRNVAPKAREIGMVFQNYALYPHFAGEGNLSFFFWVRKAPNQAIEERIRITSELMGIGFQQLLQRKPGTLSGGQQQRLAIARAIVRSPRLFLLDEPLSNLDAKLRMQTRVEIKRLLQRFQITGIYVTHDQTEAITLGDQIAVMRAGRVEQVGPFAQLMEYPANLFVAGFLGTPPMNLLPAVSVVDGELHWDELSLSLPLSVQRWVRSNQRITLGIRPEATQVVGADQPARPGLHLRGEAEVVEPDFGRRLQWVHVRRGAIRCVAIGSLDQPIYPGHPVDLFLPAEHLYFFDSATEQRIVSAL